jgi:hypothetical protein
MVQVATTKNEAATPPTVPKCSTKCDMSMAIQPKFLT